MKSLAQRVALATLLSLFVGAGNATTVSYQKSGDPFNGNGSASVWVKSTLPPVTTIHARAGGFFLRGDIFGNGVENFVGWCLDIAHYLADGKTYKPTNTPFEQDKLTDQQLGNIGRLFNTAYAQLDLSKASQSAGFQLALWEIIYEDPAKKLDLRNDSLTVTGNSAAAAIAVGQAFLDNLAGKVTQRWTLTFLESEKNQDLVTATPVPVPLSAGLMIVALGGLAVVGRRKKV